MVSDQLDRARANLLPSLHGLLFPISSKGSFYMHHTPDRIVHTMHFVTPVAEHWLESEIAEWDPPPSHCTMSGRSTTDLHFTVHVLVTGCQCVRSRYSGLKTRTFRASSYSAWVSPFVQDEFLHKQLQAGSLKKKKKKKNLLDSGQVC